MLKVLLTFAIDNGLIAQGEWADFRHSRQLVDCVEQVKMKSIVNGRQIFLRSLAEVARLS